MLEAERRYGDRVCIVRFDELVLDTAATMRRLADFLEIEFDPRLTTPTFNGYPVGAELELRGAADRGRDRSRRALQGAALDEQQEHDPRPSARSSTSSRRCALAARGVAADTRTPEPISLTATVGQLAGINGVSQATAADRRVPRPARWHLLDRGARRDQKHRARDDEDSARAAGALGGGSRATADSATGLCALVVCPSVVGCPSSPEAFSASRSARFMPSISGSR